METVFIKFHISGINSMPEKVGERIRGGNLIFLSENGLSNLYVRSELSYLSSFFLSVAVFHCTDGF